MKRRDFLRASASIAGAAVPAFSWAETTPCPPPVVSVSGGTERTSLCAVDRLADWQARSTSPGVLWAHVFERPGAPGLWWGTSGNQPGMPYNYIGTTPKNGRAEAGILGRGCMELFIPEGASTGPAWGRPLAPTTGPAAFPTGGYVPDSTDGDVNGPGLTALPVREWYSVTQGDAGAKLYNGGGGLFCHPSDYDASRTWDRSGTGGVPQQVYGRSANEADGFYVQYRIKWPTHPSGGNRLDWTAAESAGKQMNIETFPFGAQPHQIAAAINHSDSKNSVYSLFGNVGAWKFADRQLNAQQHQPGYTTACQVSKDGDKTGCWRWPKDKWVTVLVHIIPGRQNPPKGGVGWNPAWLRDVAQHFDTGIEVWVADEDRISANLGYLKIIDMPTGYAVYYRPNPYPRGGQLAAPGYSTFVLYNYMNPGAAAAAKAPHDLWVLYDQIICSTEFIPCPAA